MKKKILALFLAAVLAMPTTISTAMAEETEPQQGTSQCETHQIDSTKTNEYTFKDNTNHLHTGTCSVCGTESVSVLENHTINPKTEVYLSVDKTYHTHAATCSYCNGKISVKEKHAAFTWFKNSKGVWCYGCADCKYEEFSAALKYTIAYKKSTSIKVVLTGKVCKGDLLTVKIGNKSYKKTISSAATNPTYKLKITKPNKNLKITVYIKHNGKSIKNDYKYEYVMTSVNPKKGMSPTSVLRYTSWGSPSKTKNGSKGYVYWYYSDGSKITFKNNKVKSWTA